MALTPEQLALITTFRQETEDLFKALTRQIYFKNGVGPYADTADVLATIPESDRVAYLTLVNVNGTDYWFTDSTTLVPYVGSLSLADGAVTLAKMANMATASFIGRNTAGTGSPEILSVATVLSMLGLTNVASTLSNKVDKAEGYSLIPSSRISQIHEPGSDNQDLTAIIASIEALNSLVTSLSPPYKIVLPSADTVAGRLVGLTEGVNYPTGWVLSADDKDLIVTHGLDNSVKDVVVWSKNTLESIERKELGNAAYSGLYYPIGGATIDSVVIESLATINAEITIYISFS